MERLKRADIGQWAVLLLMAFAILWKGGKSLETTWLLGLLAAAFAIGSWLTGTKRHAGNVSEKTELPLSIWITALLFVLWSIASFITSETQNYGLDEIIHSTALILLFLWAARLRIQKESDRFLTTFPQVITASALIAACIGAWIYTLQPVNRFVGTFVDARFDTDYWPNAWAQFVLFAWPMALLLVLKHGKKKAVWIRLLVLSLILTSLALSYSRGAIIAFGAQLLMMCLLFASVVLRDIRYRRIMRNGLAAGSLATILIVVVVAGGFTGMNKLRSLTYDVQSVSEKVTFTAAEGTSSISERAQFWEQAKTLAIEKPFLGWGPYSFRFVQPALMKHVLATSDHAHNMLLKFAMERGIPTVILFMTMFGYVLSIAIFSFLNARKSYLPETDAFTIMSITALTGVLLHNFIDYNLQFVGLGLPTILAMGLLVHPSAITAKQTVSFRHWQIRKMLSRIDVVIAALLFIIVCYEGVFLVTSSFGRHALAAGQDREALSWFQRSHGSLFTRDLYLSEAQIQMRLGDLRDASVSLDRYQSLNAVDPRLWKLRGDLFLRESKPTEALVALETAYQRGKYTDLGILTLLLEAGRKQNDPTVLRARKLEFDALFDEYALSIEQNTHFIALSENVEELQAVSRLLSELFPSDEARYKTITRKAVSHARKEREQYESRPPGMLW